MHMLQCSGELAATVIGYLYTGHIEADVTTAAEIISLANLWQLPGSFFAADTIAVRLEPYIGRLLSFGPGWSKACTHLLPGAGASHCRFGAPPAFGV